MISNLTISYEQDKNISVILSTDTACDNLPPQPRRSIRQSNKGQRRKCQNGYRRP